MGNYYLILVKRKTFRASPKKKCCKIREITKFRKKKLQFCEIKGIMSDVINENQ